MMHKCTTCQYYDRKQASNANGSVVPTQQGQCRRMAPLLHPVTPKTYAIEGVWPTVRDDDWCGEWKLNERRPDARASERKPGTALGGLPAGAAHVARIGGAMGGEMGRGLQGGIVTPATIKPFVPPAAAKVKAAPEPVETTVAAVGHAGDD